MRPTHPQHTLLYPHINKPGWHWRLPLCWVVGCWLLLVTCAQAGSVINVRLLGDASYYPYAYAEGNEMKGFYTELIKRIALDLPAYRIELTPMPWKRGLRQIEQGDAFAIYPPYRFDKERPYIHPYSKPLYKGHL